jgi:CTP synthase (UTP-ammonia lyase)
MKPLRIAIIGDYTDSKHTHRALNDAIEHCRGHLNFPFEATWIATDVTPEPASLPKYTDGIWIAPGSPYKNDEAVYRIIQWARENNFPIFGTCGGFQYMVVEYAKNILGIQNAGHEESEPDAPQLVISKLSCSLKGQQEEVIITDKESWLYTILKSDVITGFFNCNYGVNAAYRDKLQQPPFVFTAFSRDGEVRGLELKGHRFFKGTLFQPPLDSSLEKPNALIMDFFRSVKKSLTVGG